MIRIEGVKIIEVLNSTCCKRIGDTRMNIRNVERLRIDILKNIRQSFGLFPKNLLGLV